MGRAGSLSATCPRHELIVEGREELLYLLGEAAGLEHSVCCVYLYAALSLRADPGQRFVAEQVLASFRPTVRRLTLPEAARAAVAQAATRLWEE